MNPLDAICDVKRNDAVCVSNLKSAKPVDKAVLQERPDVKIFLPFRFHFYKPKDLFKENTYRNFLGETIKETFQKELSGVLFYMFITFYYIYNFISY